MFSSSNERKKRVMLMMNGTEVETANQKEERILKFIEGKTSFTGDGDERSENKKEERGKKRLPTLIVDDEKKKKKVQKKVELAQRRMIENRIRFAGDFFYAREFNSHINNKKKLSKPDFRDFMTYLYSQDKWIWDLMSSKERIDCVRLLCMDSEYYIIPASFYRVYEVYYDEGLFGFYLIDRFSLKKNDKAFPSVTHSWPGDFNPSVNMYALPYDEARSRYPDIFDRDEFDLLSDNITKQWVNTRIDGMLPDLKVKLISDNLYLPTSLCDPNVIRRYCDEMKKSQEFMLMLVKAFNMEHVFDCEIKKEEERKEKEERKREERAYALREIFDGKLL